MEIQFTLNRFDDNYVRGGDAGLVYVKGGKFIAKSNIFYRSGQLDTFYYYKSKPYTFEEVDESKCSIDASLQLDDFCFHEWTQSRGIFWFTGVDNTKDGLDYSLDPVPITFFNNTVKYAFAKAGGIYSHDVKVGTQPNIVKFSENLYEHIFALDSAIMKAQMVQDSAETKIPYAVHNYTSETIHEV